MELVFRYSSGDVYHHVMRARHTTECSSLESKKILPRGRNDSPFRKADIVSVTQTDAPNLTNHPSDKGVYRRGLIEYSTWPGRR